MSPAVAFSSPVPVRDKMISAGERSCLGRWAAAVCLSRVYLEAHFPVDAAAGADLGPFIGSALNLVFGVPSASTAGASG